MLFCATPDIIHCYGLWLMKSVDFSKQDQCSQRTTLTLQLSPLWIQPYQCKSACQVEFVYSTHSSFFVKQASSAEDLIEENVTLNATYFQPNGSVNANLVDL